MSQSLVFECVVVYAIRDSFVVCYIVVLVDLGVVGVWLVWCWVSVGLHGVCVGLMGRNSGDDGDGDGDGDDGGGGGGDSC